MTHPAHRHFHKQRRRCDVCHLIDSIHHFPLIQPQNGICTSSQYINKNLTCVKCWNITISYLSRFFLSNDEIFVYTYLYIIMIILILYHKGLHYPSIKQISAFYKISYQNLIFTATTIFGIHTYYMFPS